MIAGLTFRHVDASRASDLHRDEDHASSIGRPRWSRDRGSPIYLTSLIRRPHEAQSASLREDRGSVGFRSDGQENPYLPLFVKIGGALDSNPTMSAACGRTPRSRPDRTAIAERSNRDRGDFAVESSPVEQTVIDEALTPRSTPDPDPIVTRSWRKSWQTWSEIEAKLKPIRRGIEATTHAAMPKELPPRRLKTAPTNASIAHDLRANFPL